MAEKRIPVTEAAQRVVEAVEEVVSYELRGNTLRFNFDHPRRLYPTKITSSRTRATSPKSRRVVASAASG